MVIDYDINLNNKNKDNRWLKGNVYIPPQNANVPPPNAFVIDQVFMLINFQMDVTLAAMKALGELDILLNWLEAY